MKVKILLLVLLPALVSIATIGIYLIEGHHEGSDFHSLFNSFWWTIVTFTTVGYGDMSPATVEGRLFGVVVLFMGVVINAMIISLISNWYFHFQSAREKGLKRVLTRDHVVICSDDAEFFVSVIKQHEREYISGRVVLFSPTNEHPILGTEFRKARWVAGQGIGAIGLERAGIDRAKVAYISYRDDSQTVMVAMQVHNLSAGRTRIMALVSQADHRKHLEDVGCDYILNPHDLYVPLMVKASLSPGVPEWIRQVILGHSKTPTIENRSLRNIGRASWGRLLSDMNKTEGSLPMGVVDRNGTLHANPPIDTVLQPGDRVMVLVPPSDKRYLGEVGAECSPPEGGPMLVMSDKAEFISRILQELDMARVENEVIVLSELEPFAYLSEKLNYRWVHATSYSHEGLNHADAKRARIAFIDHEHDRHTLMAVLRLETMSKGRCFAIASYREQNFDHRLKKVGAHFTLNANELVVPLLAQSTTNYGIGVMVEEVISQHPKSESLFVARLNNKWSRRSWRKTVLKLKDEYDYLPVAVMKGEHDRLVVYPGPQTEVAPGDSLLLLATTGSGITGSVFDLAHVSVMHHHDDFDLGRDPEKMLQKLLNLAHSGDAHAQCRLGECHEKGKGVERNLDHALKWYEKAARMGHARALFKLGTFHYQGVGVGVDRQRAVKLIQKAANQGYLPARQALDWIKESKRWADNREHLLDHDLLEHLEGNHKGFYLKALIRMMSVGKSNISVFERGLFKQAAQLTRDRHLIHDIEQGVLFGEHLELPAVEGLSPLERKLILDELVDAGVADGAFTREKEKFLREVGKRIAAEPEAVEQRVHRGYQSTRASHKALGPIKPTHPMAAKPPQLVKRQGKAS